MPDSFFETPTPTPAKPRILSITELTRTVRDLLEGAIGDVWVEGEVCNYRKQSSGHQYFGLKDDRAQLSCVLFFRPGFRQAGVVLTDGMLVHVRGRITVYEARGQYQMIVSLVQPAGAGLLAAKFEALKRKLAAEGLFESDRKRPLPPFPMSIGIVTSPTGAAVRDMLNILHRRAPWVRIVINPVRVQGAGAAAEIAAAIDEFNSGALPGAPVDVIVVARGGGSAEDLWEFNEEAVARAIYASAIPVVSAVGHEIDFTIADFVADLRAPTPSAAAELVAPDSADLVRRFSQMQSAMERCARDTVEAWRQQLGFVERGVLFREPRARVDSLAQQLDLVSDQLSRSAKERVLREKRQVAELQTTLREHRPDQLLALRRQQLNGIAGCLQHARVQRFDAIRHSLEGAANLLRVLGPQATLGRGYTITRTEAGEIVRSVAQAPPGTRLRTRVPDGEIQSKVPEPARRRESGTEKKKAKDD